MWKSPPSTFFKGALLLLASWAIGSRLLGSELFLPANWFDPAKFSPGTWAGFWGLVQAHPGGHPDLLAKILIWLEFPLFGYHAAPYHAANLLLHGCNAILVWRLGRQLGLKQAWWAGLLFAVHPVAIEPVVWLPYAGMLLGSLFSLIILLTLTARPIRVAGYTLSLMALPMALFANVNAGLIALVALATRVWQHQSVKPPVINPLLPHLLLCFFLIIQINSVISPGSETQCVDSEIVLLFQTAGSSELLYHYVGKLFFPSTLAFWHHDPVQLQDIQSVGVTRLSRVTHLFAWAILLAVGIGFRKHAWARSLLLFLLSLLLFLIPLLRVIPLGAPLVQAFCNYLAYLALVPFVLFLVACIFSGRGTAAQTSGLLIRSGLTGTLVVVFAASYWLNSANYQNTIGLWEASIRTQEANIQDDRRLDNFPIIQLAKHYLQTGEREQYLLAAEKLGKVIERVPNDADALETMGDAQERLHNYSKAAYFYQSAAEVRQKVPSGSYSESLSFKLAEALQADGRSQEARRHLEIILQNDPENVRAIANLASLYFSINRFADALPLYQRRFASNPDNLGLQNALIRCLLETGQIDRLVQLHRQIPGYTTPVPLRYTAIANQQTDSGNYREALVLLEFARDAEPANDLIANNLAWLLATCPRAELRDGERALQLVEQAAQRSGSHYPEIVSTLAAAHAELGNWQRAVELLESLEQSYLANANAQALERTRKKLVAYRNQTPVYQP